MLTVHTYAHHIKSFDHFNHRSMIACVLSMSLLHILVHI